MGRKTKERAATATAPAVVPTEIERAEKMIDRLEGERIKADEALKEQAEHLGRVIGVLKMMDDRGMLSLEKAGNSGNAKSAKPADVPTAGARSEKLAAGVGGIVNGYPVFDNLIRDHFERASLHEVLAALIFYEVWRIDWETPLADDLLKICIDSIENASASELEDVDFPFGVLVGMRACRT